MRMNKWQTEIDINIYIYMGNREGERKRDSASFMNG